MLQQQVHSKTSARESMVVRCLDLILTMNLLTGDFYFEVFPLVSAVWDSHRLFTLVLSYLDLDFIHHSQM